MRGLIQSALAFALLLTCAMHASAQVPGSRAMPADVQQEWKADERIFVRVYVDNLARPATNTGAVRGTNFPYGEHYGNRLGDVIAMRVEIFCVLPVTDQQKPVKLDFANSLKAGRLTIEPDAEGDPDWVFAKQESLAPGQKPLDLPDNPVRTTIVTPDGLERQADLYDIKLFVQTRRIPDPMVFWVEFGYASDVTPNGHPDWKRDGSPDFIISGSWTSDKGRDMLTGNSNFVEQQRPLWLGSAFIAAGALFVLLPLGLVVTRALRKALAGRLTPDKSEVAWAVFDRVINKTRSKTGLALEKGDVEAVVKAFKDYLGITCGTIELKDRQFEFDNGEEVYNILYSLEHGVLERDAALSDKKYAELMVRITKLCPRP